MMSCRNLLVLGDCLATLVLIKPLFPGSAGFRLADVGAYVCGFENPKFRDFDTDDTWKQASIDT